MKKPNGQCRAIRRDNSRCPNPAKIAGFCGVHYPKKQAAPETQSEQKQSFGDGVGVTANLITIATGAIALVEIIIKVWQGLLFGRGPRMPDDYEYLASKLSWEWPDFPDFVTVANWGPNTVDWKKARQLSDMSRKTLSGVESGSMSEDVAILSVAQIEELSFSLLDTLQEPFAELVYRRIGQEG